jgi:hypothetical protein
MPGFTACLSVRVVAPSTERAKLATFPLHAAGRATRDRRFIKAADEELRQLRETIRKRAAVGTSINDELIQAGRLGKLLRQKRALLEGSERLRK